MIPVKDSVIQITYNSDTHTSMQWNCPQQSRDIQYVRNPALAFYRAKNPTTKPVIWISTNNAVPFEAGQYFNKIQKDFWLPCVFYTGNELRLGAHS
uniref:Uncharacterized protein n=1 Tax=Hucho hucho TaxID=62062 RepID=A0A4W5QI09_9TELE